MDENLEISMDAPITYVDETALCPAGEYSFRILQWQRKKHDGTGKMPPHTEIRFQLELTSDSGSKVGTLWDNIRMYQKWAWKYAKLAKSIGHVTPEATQIQIRWAEFTGATGLVRIGQKPWKRSDGTEEMQNSCDYLVPTGSGRGEMAAF